MEESPKQNIAPQEKKEFLSRQDVKTMREDISGLREKDAIKERERIAEIKTGEEAILEREKLARAQKEAQERQLAEQAPVIAPKPVIIPKTPIVPAAPQPFKEVFKDVQAKEDIERKAFLERVAAKAQGEEISLIPKKPALTPKEIGTGSMAAVLVKKPSRFKKVAVRLFLGLFVLAALAAIATFWYWYLVIKEKPASPETQQPVVEELVVPASLITVQETEAIEFSNSTELLVSLTNLLKEETSTKHFTRLILEDKTKNELLGMKEFFEVLGIKTPVGLLEKIDNDFTLFSYNQRLGLIAKTKEDILPMVNSWETTMENDFNGLLVLFGELSNAQNPNFQSAKYQETSFRYLSLPQENLGLCWTTFNNYFVFTSSGESMIKIIEEIK
jgi:hypothetical protein